MESLGNKIVICLVLVAFTSACTTMRTLQPGDSGSYRGQVEIGDEIEIRKTDGSELSLVVAEITDTGLRGDGLIVAYADISELRVRKTSASRSALLGVGILVGAILVGLLLIDEADIFPTR